MNSSTQPFRLILAATAVALLMLVAIGCEPEYTSPGPGIIDVRLKTVSNDIHPDPLNNFILTVTEVKAIRSDDVQVIIYADLEAIERKETKLNTLDFRAVDSSLIIGQTYVPPGDYKGVDLLMEPARQVILDGYRVITVEREPDFDTRLSFRSPFSVSESKTTEIVLEVNLDSTLLKKANTYLFRPYYTISSINHLP